MTSHACLFGATGATGRLVAQALLDRQCTVTAVVRDANRLPESLQQHPALHIVEANITEMTPQNMAQHIATCDTVISCLGHTLSFSGIWGHPRRLVTDTMHKVVAAVKDHCPEQRTKIILMNTVGNANRGLPEKPPLSQRAVVWLLRYLLPPHADNEQAAEALRTKIDPANDFLSWVAVRPDALIDEDEVSPYTQHPSPIRNAIFNSGKISRINVADFIAELTTDEDLWQSWQGQMPVIYNKNG